MRVATLTGVALIALSTAAIAQVASTPVEQKVPLQTPANGTDDAAPGDTTDTPGNAAPVATTSPAPANAAPPAGEPMADSSKPGTPR